MTSFTLPSDHWAPVRTACHSLFPLLNRFRFPGSLHRSPSIQLHLQHDSMVDVSPPLRLIDFKLRVYTTLSQSRAIVLSKPHKPSSLHHVFPRPRSRPPSASRSYVVVAEITTVFCFDRHPRRSIRLSSPTQPNSFDCMTRSRLPNHIPRIFIHHT